jgi:glycosidase
VRFSCFALAAPWCLCALAVAAVPPAAADDWPPAPRLVAPTDDSPGALPPSVSAVRAPSGAWRTTFRYTPQPAAQQLALVGTFNGWNREVDRFQGPDAAGQWTITLELPAGRHEYKFLADGARWITDPQNSESAPDNHGGRNSLLKLGRLAHLDASPAKPGDGWIDADGLQHDPARPLYVQRVDRDHVLVRYRTFSNDATSVAFAPRSGAAVPLTVLDAGPLFTLWEAVVPLPKPAPAALEYTFVLADGAARVADLRDYRRDLTMNEFQTPDWAKHAVWYQIMIDRFRNGDPANDPPDVVPWRMEWFRSAPHEGRDGQTFYKGFVFQRLYGGDLKGVEEKLPYLKELGVNAIYFNPVFKAASHHKYDATNYVHIDDHFGTKGDYDAAAAAEKINDPKTWTWTETDKQFLAFLGKAKRMGFRVIIDGVWNHVGVPHPAFQDVRRNGKDSAYADWFDVTSWEPFRYNGWAGVDSLPAFKKSKEGIASRAVVEHIHAVTRRWMDPDGDGDPSDGIDGWRLDVPMDIPMPFWVEWRELVKSINPDAYLTGEVWQRADEWLDGQKFDAVMNYMFVKPVVAWVGNRTRKLKVSELDRRLRELRLAYPLAATLVMQNLVDSHDTDRLVSQLLNPDREYDEQNRVQDNGPNYDNHKPGPEHYRKARLIVLLQMTYIGAPMIYYGDEAGMWGADDPTCRKPMLWEDLQPYEKPDENFVMKDHLDFYKRAIALRNAHPALRTGSFRTLLVEDDLDVWAFLRADEVEQLIVVLNASETQHDVAISLAEGLPRTWEPVFGEPANVSVADSKLRLRIPALSGVVLAARP